MSDVKVIMYHHTHWDREWWTTFQNFRFRLVNHVDALLDLLDADPGFRNFVLDGQTIVLKDYLEVRPENRERLTRRINEGRISVGPWHILPDEFLVSGEATIRNLWLGERTARQNGIFNVKVGYLPDQFGHIGQMPQILAGFGIDHAVVWRGFGAPPPGVEGTGTLNATYEYPKPYNAERFPTEIQSEFWWEAEDGTRIMATYLPCEYYRSHYVETPDLTVGRSRRFVNFMRKYAATRYILEPMGGDHLPVDPRLPRILGEINRELAAEGIEYSHGSLAEYVAAVHAENPELSTVWHGEGRAFGRKAYMLPAVLSSRLYLKQMNRDCQVALERYAEPFQALTWMLGGRYEQNYLWLAWEKLIQNHPHDSICGCSTDQVHKEMVVRFDEAKQMADLLAQQAQEDLAARIDLGFVPEGAQAFVVSNPLTWTRTDTVRVHFNPHFGINPAEWALKDHAGNEIPFQVRPVRSDLLKVERFDWLGLPPGPYTGESANDLTEVEFVAAEVAPLGYRAYYLERRPKPVRSVAYTVQGIVARGRGDRETTGLSFGPGVLENQHLRVMVDLSNGSLAVQDKETGYTYTGLNQFRDGGDAGDTYNYAWPVGDQVLTTAAVQPRLSWVECGPARATLRVTWPWALPAGLTADRGSRAPEYVPVELHSDITLYPGVKRVDVRTHFANTAKDHRLQALFPFGAPVSRSAAESVFSVVERPAELPVGERGSAEPQVHEHPQMTFVSVTEGGRGLTIANRGLPEFSVADDTIALTVLRSVGWLSREDLTTRAGGAGPVTVTPGAQMLGPVVAEYSIIPHAGTWDEAKSYRAAHDFNAPLTSVTLVPQWAPMRSHYPVGRQELPPAGSLLAVEGDLLLTALKKAEDREALVVRFVNESAGPGGALLRPLRAPARAFLVNLREDVLAELPVGTDGTVRIEAAPWQLVTVALEF
ncbi:MAG TPA: glycoside hydrolase family 38 C-terminal domain-containing protein [Symbiobacteriaceae bacterium]|nr:glycoside hydrolase family 38 C-terminal domain-containing protein [Symbiobacteriaceae bacterium]